MATATSGAVNEIEIFRHNARTTRKIVHLNAEGITHEESLIQPHPAGNCANWVLGHLLSVYEGMLAVLRQEPVMGKEALKRYARGTPPLHNPAEAINFDQLLAAWDKAGDRIDAGLENLTPEMLDAPAPFSPSKNPNETVRTLLAVMSFHQAYHAGQLGILRRLAGKKGAIA
ncbi:MAG: DinB family protein [Terriglobales bacterium]